jgi:hypothetical protein
VHLSTGFVEVAGKKYQFLNQKMDKQQGLAYIPCTTKVFPMRSLQVGFNTLQVSLMNSFSPHQPTVSWWVEVNTSAPQQTYHVGPFNTQEEAKLSRGAHVDALYHKDARDIVALIKQR